MKPIANNIYNEMWVFDEEIYSSETGACSEEFWQGLRDPFNEMFALNELLALNELFAI